MFAARLLGERKIEAPFGLKAEPEGFAKEARELSSVLGQLDTESVEVERLEGLGHRKATELALVAQLTVKKHQMALGVQTGAKAP